MQGLGQGWGGRAGGRGGGGRGGGAGGEGAGGVTCKAQQQGANPWTHTIVCKHTRSNTCRHACASATTDNTPRGLAGVRSDIRQYVRGKAVIVTRPSSNRCSVSNVSLTPSISGHRSRPQLAGNRSTKFWQTRKHTSSAAVGECNNRQQGLYGRSGWPRLSSHCDFVAALRSRDKAQPSAAEASLTIVTLVLCAEFSLGRACSSRQLQAHTTLCCKSLIALGAVCCAMLPAGA